MASSSTFVTTTNPNKWAEEKKQFLKEKFIELIIKVPLFQALSKDNLNRIADSFTEIKFNDKDVIIREGELGEVMYILKSGKVNIYKQMSDESPKPTFIRTLEPPSYDCLHPLYQNYYLQMDPHRHPLHCCYLQYLPLYQKHHLHYHY